MLGGEGAGNAGTAQCVFVFLRSVVDPGLERAADFVMQFEGGMEVKVVKLVGAVYGVYEIS